MNKQELINAINAAIPKAKAVCTSEFYNNGNAAGIWLRGSEEVVDGMRIFDDNHCDDIDSPLHPTLQAIVDKAGWYCEPYDAGTAMLYY